MQAMCLGARQQSRVLCQQCMQQACTGRGFWVWGLGFRVLAPSAHGSQRKAAAVWRTLATVTDLPYAAA